MPLIPGVVRDVCDFFLGDRHYEFTLLVWSRYSSYRSATDLIISE